jgi:hypothetical protein
MHGVLPVFAETYTVVESGQIVDYWCSNNQKVIVPPALYSSPLGMLYCEESIPAMYIGVSCGTPCYLAGPYVELLKLNYTNPVIDLFVCEEF